MAELSGGPGPSGETDAAGDADVANEAGLWSDGSIALPRDATARALVEKLGLQPHPEGGWFRRTWTAAARWSTDRAAGSSIQYLLDSDTTARWHRIDATELWIHLMGAPLRLTRYSEVTGLRIDAIESGPSADPHGLQAVVGPDEWQQARTTGDWSLVTCVVIPEFTFEGFELAPPGWEPPNTTPR